MNGEFLTGLVLGLFGGGIIGTLALALVAAGSDRRMIRGLGERQRDGT